MDKQTFDILWHFSEKLTRDPDDRMELVLMAWKESYRLGKIEIPLLINFMKLRSKELDKRSALGVKISGKSAKDAWHSRPISISAIIDSKSGFTIGDTITCCSYNPLGMCIVNDFEDALDEEEERVADSMVAGYNATEIMRSLGVTRPQFLQAKQAVQDKAVEYLR